MSKNNKTSTGPLTTKHIIGYGAGDCGGVVTLIMFGSYLTRYVTNILDVSYGILATLLLIWNIWDAINDPLVGTLMDKAFAKQTDHTKDKFRPWIKWSIPIIVLGHIAFFTVPNYLSGLTQVVILFLLKIVYEWGYTMMNIAMGSLLGVQATNDTERATLSSARGMGSTVGALIATVAIPKVLEHFGENRTGYMWASIVTATIGAVLIWIHYAWTEERNVLAKAVQDEDGEQDEVKATDIFNVFRTNRAFLALALHSVLIVFAQNLFDTTRTYILADVYGDMGLMATAGVIGQVIQIIALTVAPKLAEKLGGTVKLIRIGLVVGALIFVGTHFAMKATLIPAMAYVALTAVGYGLFMLSVQMQWGLVSESIDYNEYISGKRTEGAIYGTFSLTRRIGQTLAQSSVVYMIGKIGYDADLGTNQAAATVEGLKNLNLLIPAILVLGSYICFRFIWNIDDELRAEIRNWKVKQLESVNLDD